MTTPTRITLMAIDKSNPALPKQVASIQQPIGGNFASAMLARGDLLFVNTGVAGIYSYRVGSVPHLVNPPDGVQLPAMGPIDLGWSNPTGSSQYQIQVWPENNDGPGIDLIRNAEEHYTLQPPRLGEGSYILLPDMTYHWRVRTTDTTGNASPNDASWDSWSEPFTFHTPQVSSAGLVAITPTNGAQTARSNPVLLQWTHPNPTIFYWELEVSKNPAFNVDPATATDPVWRMLLHGGVTDPLNSWSTPPVEPGVTYYWHVRPRIQGDGRAVAWGQTWRFYTGLPNT